MVTIKSLVTYVLLWQPRIGEGRNNGDVSFCNGFNIGESEFEMKATIEYDLSNPADAYAYKCAERAKDAVMLIESLKQFTQGYTAYKGISESVLADIISDLSQWDDVKL